MKLVRVIIILLLLPYYQGCKADTHFTLLDVSKNILPIIVTPNKLSPDEELSLQKLIEAFDKTCNKKLVVKNESQLQNADLQKNIIYFGATKAFESVNHPAVKQEGFYIYQKSNAIYIASKNSNNKGIWTALNYFIEQYLDGFNCDEGATLFSKKNVITIPINLAIHEEPPFEFRQAYFPASNNSIYYQGYHGTNNFENEWICWGHNLSKFLKKGKSKFITNNVYALINGKRNEEQFCFTNDELYNQIVTAINGLDIQLSGQKFSVAPNDNSFVCQCEKCQSINGDTKNASNAVCYLLNKLATRFPNLIFTTLAYVTTLKAPTNVKLKSNTVVLLSTIDIPKGIPIENQKQFLNFNETLRSWQKVCSQIYVWDYPIQYTNYFDVFPNMPAVQADIQYFKKAGIKGVFSQGSEENYSLFCEWKCFAISKLLWNPEIDLANVRSNFFIKFYGEAGKEIEYFYANCEKNLETRKATLDIYGNVQLAHKAYLDYEQLKNLVAYLRKQNSVEANKNPREYYNVDKLASCLEILLLQYNRWKGIHDNGYAIAKDKVSWMVKPEIVTRVAQLQKSTLSNEIEFMNENRDRVSDYLQNCATFFKQANTKNLIWQMPIKYNTFYDDSYPANGPKTLTDGMNGTEDYSFNWLLFNANDLDVSIENVSIQTSNKLSVQFLNDPTHYIFTPSSISLFAGNSLDDLKLVQTINPAISQKMEAKIFSYNFELKPTLKNAKVIRLVAKNWNQLPDWKQHPTKKPSIACDEINIK